LKQIELFLDGELEGGMRAEMEEHLGRCGPCTDHSDFQRRLRELLKAKCGCDEVPASLLERVRTLIGETPEHRHP
jgi:mycothiol system anti-sigma-R factor